MDFLVEFPDLIRLQKIGRKKGPLTGQDQSGEPQAPGAQCLAKGIISKNCSRLISDSVVLMVTGIPASTRYPIPLTPRQSCLSPEGLMSFFQPFQADLDSPNRKSA